MIWHIQNLKTFFHLYNTYSLQVGWIIKNYIGFIVRHKFTYLTSSQDVKCKQFQASTVIKIWFSGLHSTVDLFCFTLPSILYFRRLTLIFLIYFNWISKNQVVKVSSICFRHHENLTKQQAENNKPNLQRVSWGLY